MTIPIDVPMTQQCMQFLFAVLLGVCFGILYCCLRALGRRGAAFLWDLIFVIVSLAFGTVFFMTVCEGYPRFFHLLGLALGAVLVFLCLGRIRAFRKEKKEYQ